MRLAIAVFALLVSSCGATGNETTTQIPATGTVPVTAPDGPPPVADPRRSHNMIAVGVGELLVAGGQTVVGNSVVWLGDTWIYDTTGGTWDELGTVPVRAQHALASDGKNTLLFGGYAGSDFVYGDARLLSFDDWIDIVDSGRPSARTGAVMAYDSESERFVVFGGDEAPFDARLPTNETWTFDAPNRQWRLRQPEVAPVPQSEGHPTLFELAMVYDEAADRMLLLIGGDELWAYDTNTDTWEQRAEPGSQADFMVAAAYHAGLGQLITYGGAPTGETAETWAYDYATDLWQRINTATSPGPLADHAMAYDPHTDAVYMFGGAATVLSQSPSDPPSGAMWKFDGEDWHLVG